MNFAPFGAAVAARVAELTRDSADLFVVDAPYEDLWAHYLAQFPNDPIFRERGEHDCSCCRHFIRDVGAVVRLDSDGQYETIWDTTDLNPDSQYGRVARAMAAYIRTRPIKDLWVPTQTRYGTEKNVASIDGAVHTFHHFHCKVPAARVKLKDQVGALQGERRTRVQTYLRALSELKLEAVDTVLELIASGSLYRGEEHRRVLELLRSDLVRDRVTSRDVWARATSPVATVRNSAIGSLLVDLSEGRELEAAVKAFEEKVAPANYKRPKALVTARMVEDAKAKVLELGLDSALERRYATLADISINDVIWADRGAARAMKEADAFAGVAAAVDPKRFDRLDKVPIADFIEKVLPTASKVEVLFEPSQISKLVSLVTEQAPSERLFKWNNPFSWSYNGDFTDAIKERVKAAGGEINAELCCRLAWENGDDLDLHMLEPGGYQIYFGNRSYTSPNGGRLDVDANAGGVRRCPGRVLEPVENIFYREVGPMRSGVYRLMVRQYCRMESKDDTFTVQIELRGQTWEFSGKNPGTARWIEVADIHVKHGEVSVVPLMDTQIRKVDAWGMKTGEFQEVSCVLKSPNHWDGEKGIGNLHWFFMLKDCVNEGDARGFYNEFLRADLDKHRKVLEIVGGKQRTAVVPDQLSGIGFSSTSKAELTVKVTGKTTRVLKVTF